LTQHFFEVVTHVRIEEDKRQKATSAAKVFFAAGENAFYSVD
jgi:hypothetical protein